MPDLLQTTIQRLQGLFGEATTDAAGEQEPGGPVVADEQTTEVFAPATWWRIAADHEFLGSREFDLDPGAAAPAAFVDRGKSLGNQARPF